MQLLNTRLAVYLGMIHILLPFMILPLYAVMKGIDRNLMRAAGNLGAPPSKVFMRIFLPLSLPGVAAGCLLVFASSVSAFVTQTLVGGGQHIFMPFYMYQQAIQANDYPFAAAVAVLLLACVMVVATLINLLGRRTRGFVHA